jgi:hypothetical protein
VQQQELLAHQQQQQQQQQLVQQQEQLAQQQQQRQLVQQQEQLAQQQQQQQQQLVQQQQESSPQATAVVVGTGTVPSSLSKEASREYTSDRSMYDLVRGEERKNRLLKGRAGQVVDTGVQRDKRLNRIPVIRIFAVRVTPIFTSKNHALNT